MYSFLIIATICGLLLGEAVAVNLRKDAVEDQVVLTSTGTQITEVTWKSLNSPELYSITVCRSDLAYGIALDLSIVMFDGTKWHIFERSPSWYYASCNSNGDLWATKKDSSTWKYTTTLDGNGDWVFVEGWFTFIHVIDNENVWGIGADKLPYHLTAETGWKKLEGGEAFYTIAASSNGQVWATNMASESFRLEGDRFVKIPNHKLSEIAATPGNDKVYGINAGRNSFSSGGYAEEVSQWDGTGFQQLSGQAIWISVADDGTVISIKGAIGGNTFGQAHLLIQ